ncbi:MAG: sigma-70 family RNA polymerase sigma factor [Lachnospiraceae bacterium]|nr:sigma-70 family RNA polymerase sigma factor [Lachnospiraceae bacterium]
MLAMYMALIEECDKEKFERLYYTYNKMMFEIANSILCNVSLADETVQDCMLKLANSITELPNIPSESAKALIISMVKNKARNNLKAEHYDKVEPMDENQIPDTVMSDISFALRYKELIEMVNTLEQQYREVLVMRLVNGLSVNEISEKLDLPYRTVETRIFRARKKLKDRLKEMYDE